MIAVVAGGVVFYCAGFAKATVLVAVAGVTIAVFDLANAASWVVLTVVLAFVAAVAGFPVVIACSAESEAVAFGEAKVAVGL